MRLADETETIEHKGMTVTVKTWCDPTDLPWDGDFELDENAEGWDLYVEASTTLDGFTFIGRDSLGSIWIDPGPDGTRYLREETSNVTHEALVALDQELTQVVQGRDVKSAGKSVRAARKLLAKGQKVAS